MTTTVHLVRHGRTAWHEPVRFAGSSDIPLDEVGRQGWPRCIVASNREKAPPVLFGTAGIYVTTLADHTRPLNGCVLTGR